MNIQSEDLKSCINLCWLCRHECQKVLFNVCLPTGGKHAEADHVRLMMDCVEMCQTAADFMVRGSPLHVAVCSACADVCEACAESCEALQDKDMKECAALCRQCADSCRKMGKLKQAA